MVFLGGAVLANIVSLGLSVSVQLLIQHCRWRTSTTCGYRKKSGKNRVLEHWTSLVQDDGELGHQADISKPTFVGHSHRKE